MVPGFHYAEYSFTYISSLKPYHLGKGISSALQMIDSKLREVKRLG